MGGAVSNPVDESTKNEIAELIKSIIGTFTLQYTKWYTIFLAKKLKDDAKLPPKPWKLLKRPPSTAPLKTGWLTKEGGSRKTWKKRFFVARGDFIVDYYEKDDEWKKEKPKTKGTMSLCGYSVVEDPNDGVMKRLRDLAEKFKMDVSAIPKPKEYPKLTFEIHHYRRRSYFITAENEEEFKSWVDTFKYVCYRAYGLTIRDPVHIRAFHEAVRRTRWELGRWGWSSYGGSEVQILSDIIADQIDYAVMGRIYDKIQGPWQIRYMIRNKVLSILDGMISTAVAPAWKGMAATVEKIRPELEPKIAVMVDPIGTAEGELINKIKEVAMSAITPLLEQHVTPHLQKIMEAIQKPMVDAYDDAQKFYDEKVGGFEVKGPKADLEKSFHPLDHLQHSSEIWACQRKIDVMYDPLWALNVIFPDIYPWSMIWKGHNSIKRTFDQAVYTWEQRLLKTAEENEACLADGKATNDTVRSAVLEDYKFDSNIRITRWYTKVIRAIIMPPFNAVVIPACKTIITPIGDTVPDAMKEFVNIEGLFDDLLDQIINESIAVVLSSGQK